MKLSPYPTHGSMSLGVTLGMNFVKQTSRLKYVGEFVRDCRCFELKVLNLLDSVLCTLIIFVHIQVLESPFLLAHFGSYLSQMKF